MSRPTCARIIRHSFCLALAVFFSGCANAVTYKASSLPAELAAPPVLDVEKLEVTQRGASPQNNTSIYPGDSLKVSVSAGDGEEARPPESVLVADDGSINVPLVGTVPVAELDLFSAAEAVRDAAVRRQLYVSPSVTVRFEKRELHRIIVTGAVNKPGVVELRPDATSVAGVLMAAGGLSANAVPNIDIRAPADDSNQLASETLPIPADYESTSSETSGDIRRVSLIDPPPEFEFDAPVLPDGTLIHVKEQPERYVTTIGLTGNQVIDMPYDRDFRVLDALAAAGGPRYSYWINNKLKVYRRHPQTGETVAIKVSFNRAKSSTDENIRLAPGDTISVEETPLTFTLSTLQGLLGVGVTAARGAAGLR